LPSGQGGTASARPGVSFPNDRRSRRDLISQSALVEQDLDGLRCVVAHLDGCMIGVEGIVRRYHQPPLKPVTPIAPCCQQRMIARRLLRQCVDRRRREMAISQ
jgi:hypothetical protein